MTHRVAVIGAGFSGLACALALVEAGVAVEMFEKGRRPGGRCASRQGPSFDHGAQFATARGTDFREVMHSLANAGVAAPWPAASEADQTRWVGVLDMAAMPKTLSDRLPTSPRLGRHVAWLERAAGWLIRHHPSDTIAPGSVTPHGGDISGPYDAVALALPAPQATSLLAESAPELAQRAKHAYYAPCWAVMAVLSEPLDVPDVVRAESGAVRWMARESSRPGRERWPERFVLHAGAAWSRDHLDLPAAEAASALVEAAGLAPAVAAATAHRWRYALVEQALGEPCLWAPERRLGACGDWCLGGRIEAAWDSGRALAARILER